MKSSRGSHRSVIIVQVILPPVFQILIFMGEESDSASVEDIAVHLFANINSNRSTEMKYTFQTIWMRLTPAHNQNNHVGMENHAPIPNLTVTEVFCSCIIEYFVSRNFMISFDGGQNFLMDGESWRTFVPCGSNMSLFNIHVKMFDQSFEVGCTLHNVHAVVHLTHLGTARFFSANIPISQLRSLQTNFARNEYLQGCNRFISIVISFLDRKFNQVMSAAYENRDPPSHVMTPIVMLNE